MKGHGACGVKPRAVAVSAIINRIPAAAEASLLGHMSYESSSSESGSACFGVVRHRVK